MARTTTTTEPIKGPDGFTPPRVEINHNLDDRVRTAVKRFRHMQPRLEAFARAVSGNRKLKIKMTGGRPCTDGNIIYLQPNIELGDKLEHNRPDCGIRDDELQMICPACAVEDDVLTVALHEIAHLVFDTFAKTSDRDKAALFERAVREYGKSTGTDGAELARKIADRINQYKEAARREGFEMDGSYMGLAKMTSPYFPFLLNALEDARVNLKMGSARPGVAEMLESMAHRYLALGQDKGDGTRFYWKDAPLNSQAMIAMFALSSRYDCTGWFNDRVMDLLSQPEIEKLAVRVGAAPGVADVYALCFPILAEMRKHGFCMTEAEREEAREAKRKEREEEAAKRAAEKEEEADASESESGSEETGDSEPDAEPSEAGSESEGSSSDGPSDEADGDGEPQPADTGDAPEAEPSADGDDGEGQSTSGDASSPSGPESPPEDDSVGDDSEPETSGSAGTATSAGDDSGEVGDESTDRSGDDAHPEPDADSDSDQDELASGEDVRGDSDDADRSSDDLTERQSEHSETADDLPDDPDAEGMHGEGDIDADPLPVEEQELGEPEHWTDEDDSMWGDEETAGRDQQVFGGHDPERDGKIDEDLLDGHSQDEVEKNITKAVEQGEMFDQPSYGLGRARIHQQTPSRNHACFKPDSWYGPREVTVTELHLGPALLKMRAVFDENRRAKMVRNLKAGRINTNRLGLRAASDDPRMFQKRRLPGKRDWFVCIMVDLSGSTGGSTLDLEINAVRAQCELLSRVGITFEVWGQTGFSDGGGLNLDIYQIKGQEEPWDEVRRTRLMNMSSGQANLDGHAMEFARKRCDQSTATDKLIMYYTDGAMPAENRREELQVLLREIELIHKKGYGLAGVGVEGARDTEKYGMPTVGMDRPEDIRKVVDHLDRVIEQMERGVKV